jgi:hypothetical protein
LRFSAGIIGLILLAAACGPKPEFRVSTDGSPKAVWETFLNRLPDNDSLAIKGKIKLISDKTYQFGFEAFYLNRDTLNFTAHSILGAGWVKVLLVGDSVYIANSRDQIPVLYDKDDQIIFGDSDNQINVSAILKALFLNTPPREFELFDHEKTLFNYKYVIGRDLVETYVDSDNCLAVKQITRTDSNTYKTQYFAWKMVNKNQFYPTKIVMESSSSSVIMQFQIKNIKIGVKLPRDLFFHNSKG